MVVRLKLGLYGTPRHELASTVDGGVPDWIESLYESYGTSSDRAPARASVLALAESLGYRLRKLSLLLSVARLHAPSTKMAMFAGPTGWSHS